MIKRRFCSNDNKALIWNSLLNENVFDSLDDKFDGFHYYLSFIKFGIGRCTSDASHEIRDQKIERDEGIALVKRYDGEFPKKYLEEFLDYTELDMNEFNLIIDSWRSDHLWDQHKNGEWFLKKPIWEIDL